MVPKLIYSKTKTAFESYFTDLSVNSQVYKSIVFTEDGYFWTHGKFFRLFPDSVSTFIASYNKNIVTLSDANGINLGEFDRGLVSLSGDSIVSVSGSNGELTITHAKKATIAGNYGPAADSDSTINVPKLSYDEYGHIITSGQQVATLNKVLVTQASNASNYYLTFSDTNSTSTESIFKASNLYFNPATGALYATDFYKNGSSISTIFAPILHSSSDSTYGVGNSSLYGHLRLSDSILLGSSDVTGGVAATPKAVYDALESAKSYANTIIAGNDAMVFRGTLGTGGTVTQLPTNSYNTGWTYRVITAGTYAGVACEIGDLILAINDGPATGAVVINSDWTVAQTNIDGSVTTTSTLTANSLLLGDGSKTIKSLIGGTNGQMLKLVSGIPTWSTVVETWREIKLSGVTKLASTDNTALDFISGSGIGLSFSGGQLTISNTGILSSDVVALTIASSGTSLGTYSPVAAARTINFNSGLTASFSTDTFTIGHTNSVVTQGTSAIRSFTYDAQGHITGSTVVTALKSPNAITFSDAQGVPVTMAFDGSVAQTVKFAPATGDVRVTAALASNVLTYTLGITHRYRPINFIPSGGTSTAVYNDSTATALTLAAGTNVQITNSPNGTLTFSSTNTWRNVSAYSTSNTLTQILSSSAGTSDLQFGSEFLWDSTNEELKLGWAEVAVDGTITYAF